MEDVSKKIAFLEARVTLLERQFATAKLNPPQADLPADDFVPPPVHIACNEPGLLIFRMYPVETDHRGEEFCWIGNDGPIQFVLPVRPSRPITCRLRIKPHPQVDTSNLTALVNDTPDIPVIQNIVAGATELSFEAPASRAANVNILLFGMKSVRPADFGENTDNRLLAARFFGADIAFS